MLVLRARVARARPLRAPPFARRCCAPSARGAPARGLRKGSEEGDGR